MNEEILLIQQGEYSPLHQRAMREGLYGLSLEAALQELLEKHPEVIPGGQIAPGSDDPPKFILVRKEASLGAWSLDHLFVDQYGVPTLIECKLIQNPQSRREVIGQIIEYAANANTAWSGGQLRHFAADTWAKKGLDVSALLEEKLGIEDEDLFWSTVDDNLDNGNIRLIIAGDEIRPEVRRMIEFLNREMHRIEILGLEIKCFGNSGDNLVLVPSLVGQVQVKSDYSQALKKKERTWSLHDLREVYETAQNRVWANAILKLLEWTNEKRRFREARGVNANFHINDSSGAKLGSVYVKDGVWLYAKDSSGASRIGLVESLKENGFLNPAADVETHAKLSEERTESAIDLLISILDTA